MAIRDLHDGAETIITGLHPRLAVICADPEQRRRLRHAVSSTPGVRVVDAAGVDARRRRRDGGAAVHAQSLDGLEEGVARFRQLRDQAGEALVQAVAGVEASLGALDDFDQAERELERAQLLRDQASAAEALEARRLAEVLERRLRLTEQRRDAIRVIEEIEAGGPARRSPELRRQIADMEAGLARAEAEQTRAERASEATLHQARESRQTACAELERADRMLRADLPGAPGVSTHDWPSGPPLPVLVAERRDRITSVLAERYEARAQARAAVDEASSGLRDAERELAEARATAAELDSVSLIESLFGFDDPELARRGGGRPTVVCDEAFTGVDPSVVASVVEHVVHGSDVQVVILTEDPALVGWAAGLAPETGLLVTVAGTGTGTGTGSVGDGPGRSPAGHGGSATITPLRPLAGGSQLTRPSPVPAPQSASSPPPVTLPGRDGLGPTPRSDARDRIPFTDSCKEPLRHVSTYP